MSYWERLRGPKRQIIGNCERPCVLLGKPAGSQALGHVRNTGKTCGAPDYSLYYISKQSENPLGWHQNHQKTRAGCSNSAAQGDIHRTLSEEVSQVPWKSGVGVQHYPCSESVELGCFGQRAILEASVCPFGQNNSTLQYLIRLTRRSFNCYLLKPKKLPFVMI